MLSRRILLSALRCFNVAAICALAVWHGYQFYLQQAVRNAAPAYVFTKIAVYPEPSVHEATL
jgi:hypothetical protein